MRNLKHAALAGVAALAVGVSACGGDDASPASTGGASSGGASLSGSIAGAGASSQAAAMEAWIAGFQASNPDVTVAYDPIGSGGGREQFTSGGTLFGGTDAPLEGEELAAAQERCGQVIEAPVYISPIALVHNVEGIDELRLAPATIAAIFNGDVTAWDDPRIAADNPGAELPDTRITVVHRSDESGTTENFADYLAQAAPEVWTHEVTGDWPVSGGEAAQGTSGVIDAVKAGSGTIGYADASQAGDLGVVQVKVGEEYVGPTPDAAAAIVDNSPQSEAEGEHILTYDLDRDTTTSGTYPIVLISYVMACAEYPSAEEAALVKAFVGYQISEDGQQVAAQAAGSAPLSSALRDKIQRAVDAIGSSGS